MSVFRSLALPTAAALLPGVALADPLPGNDLGLLANEEVRVVQENLYEKAGHLEVGASLGAIPNDPYYLAGTVGVVGLYHLSETLGVGLAIHGATGGPTQEADRLSEFGGAAVDSYAPTLLVDLDAQWTPIYAKLNLLGQAVVHYDVYVAGGVGAFLARRSILEGVSAGADPAVGAWNSPASVNLGLGNRFFFRAGDKVQAVHLEARDHLFLAENPDGSRWLKNNLHLTLGWSIYL